MKFSIETCILAERLGIKEAFRMIKNHGFDCVSLDIFGELENCLLCDNYLEYAKELRFFIDELGLDCNQAHAPMCFSYDDEMNENSVNWLKVARSIEFAAILGAKRIIVHSSTVPFDKKWDEFEHNIALFKSFEPIAKKSGIKIAVENLGHYDFFRKRFAGIFNTPYELKKVLDTLNSDVFTACLDIGHSAITGYSPEQFIENAEKGMITCLHIQDSDYCGDLHMLPFTCEFDWEKIMKSLKKYGYKGEITFEVLGFFKRLPNELLGAGLDFALSVGKHLASYLD